MGNHLGYCIKHTKSDRLVFGEETFQEKPKKGGGEARRGCIVIVFIFIFLSDFIFRSYALL